MTSNLVKAHQDRRPYLVPRTQEEAGISFSPWETREKPVTAWGNTAMRVAFYLAAGFAAYVIWVRML